MSGVPWWEPYLFTAGVLLGVALFFVAIGFVAQHPAVEAGMYFLLTVSAVVFAIRKPPTISSLSWSAFATAIFGVAAYSSFHNRSILIFFAYAVVDCLWFLLTVDAGMRRYKARKKALQNSGRTAAANPEHHE